MFTDYKSIIIVVLLFFLFRKKTSCECPDKELDTLTDENNETSSNQNFGFNEFTERAFENDLEDVKDYYGYN